MSGHKLWAELLLLFVLFPLSVFVWISQLSDWLMPLLFMTGVACLCVLINDKQFNKLRLWNWQDFSHHFRHAMKLFLPWASVVALFTYLFLPELFLQWPLERPELWVATLLVYPIVSVIPQEIIFRTFFFHRYKKIMPAKRTRWLVSTFLFGLAHVVYGNWIAVVATWFGGALFGYRYMTTRSTPLVVIEHTLWGSLLFTVGFGTFLINLPA